MLRHQCMERNLWTKTAQCFKNCFVSVKLLTSLDVRISNFVIDCVLMINKNLLSFT